MSPQSEWAKNDANAVETSATSRLNLGVAQTFLSVQQKAYSSVPHRQECLCHP